MQLHLYPKLLQKQNQTQIKTKTACIAGAKEKSKPESLLNLNEVDKL